MQFLNKVMVGVQNTIQFKVEASCEIVRKNDRAKGNDAT